MPTLYSTPRSANGRKVLAARLLLEVEAEVREIDVYRGEGQTPAYRAIQPFGKIPALVDGDFVLWESNAILQYLSEAYGGFRLSSREPRARADVARWLFFEASQWQPALAAVLAPAVGHRLRPDVVPVPPAPPDWHDAPLLPLLRFLDARLRDRPFLCGEALTLADLSVAGMAMYLRPTGFPFEAYPGLRDWMGRIEALDAWRATGVAPWA